MQGMTDTSPEIAEMVRARLMALSGAERFLMGVRMCEAARRMVLASLPANLPESERKRLLFERIYGELPPLSHCTPIEEQALTQGMADKAKEFVEAGAEVYKPA